MACLCLQVMLEGSLDFGELTGPVKVSRLIQLTNFTQHLVPFSVVLEGRMPVLVTPMSGELGPTGNESSVQKLQVELRATFPESIQGRLKVVTEGADVHDVVLISGIAAQVRPYPQNSTRSPAMNEPAFQWKSLASAQTRKILLSIKMIAAEKWSCPQPL